MTDLTLPSDYDAADGFTDDWLEQCPHCGLQLSGEGGHHGKVYDSTGQAFEHLLETDSSQGPFFCPDCWAKLDANQKQSDNRNLGEFA